jgi:hypothetical protein
MPGAKKRGCYCGLWETGPATLLARGLPPGYCGFCSMCGKPGHTRHFPGTSPYTGSWCDRDYRLIAVVHPLGTYGILFWAAVVGGGVLLYHLVAK